MLLSIENNQIMGTIPREIGNLTVLKKLYLGVNNLIGMALENNNDEITDLSWSNKYAPLSKQCVSSGF